jgi:hypothetical protein
MSRGADVGWIAWWLVVGVCSAWWVVCFCGVLVSGEIARRRLGCVSTLGLGRYLVGYRPIWFTCDDIQRFSVQGNSTLSCPE